MKINNALVLLFIIFASLFGLFKIKQSYNNHERTMMEYLKPIPVLIAGKSLNPGDTLNKEGLAVIHCPITAVKNLNLIKISDSNKIENRKVRNYIEKNDLLRFSDLEK